MILGAEDFCKAIVPAKAISYSSAIEKKMEAQGHSVEHLRFNIGPWPAEMRIHIDTSNIPYIFDHVLHTDFGTFSVEVIIVRDGSRRYIWTAEPTEVEMMKIRLCL